MVSLFPAIVPATTFCTSSSSCCIPPASPVSPTPCPRALHLPRPPLNLFTTTFGICPCPPLISRCHLYHSLSPRKDHSIRPGQKCATGLLSSCANTSAHHKIDNTIKNKTILPVFIIKFPHFFFYELDLHGSRSTLKLKSSTVRSSCFASQSYRGGRSVYRMRETLMCK